MKVSIITVSFNAEKTIEKTIESVLSQDYNNIEFILIDGYSTDETMNIVAKYQKDIDVVLSEKDKGIYDAINKGILLASGEVVGILNSDDVFYDSTIISEVVARFRNRTNLDSIIGDIIFLNSNGRKFRHYCAQDWNPNKFEWGIMPPHPSFYCKRNLFMKYGLYSLDFKIASDYELLIRFLFVNKITYEYIPRTLVIMSLGGVSTKNILSNLRINKEVLRACKINNINTNVFKLYTKYVFKLKELI